MRKVNKLIAVLLAFCMTLSVSVTGFAGFSDVSEKYSYKDAINTLASLGLILGYDDGTFRPSGTITRAEFSTIMARTLGMENVATGNSSAGIFTDMTTNGVDHWSSGYVRVAYDLGIIKGMGDGTFCPDNPITYEQAVKMLVCALGYETAAIDRGGWPGGYIVMGSDLGIIDSSTSYSDPTSGANRGVVAQLLYNALQVPIAEKSSGGGIVAGTKTILTDKLKAVRFNNATIVNVDGIYSLDSVEYNAKPGELVLMIDGVAKKYTYSGLSNADELKDCIGYLVSGYYKENTLDDSRTLMMLEINSNNITELEFVSDDVEDYSSRVLSYYTNREAESGKTKDIRISADANFIYNGVAVNYKTMSPESRRDLSYWLDPDSSGFFDGTVKLVDSGSDGEYDIVTMEDFETYVVKSRVTTTSTPANNFVIYDYYISGRSIRIDVEDPGIIANFYNVSTGKEMQITDLAAMDVISVAASLDETRYEVYVSRNSVKGIIEEISMDDEYVINGVEYELADSFVDAISLGKENMDTDSEGIFYLDKNGKLAAATITVSGVSNATYGYLTVVAEGGVADDGTILKIVDATKPGSAPVLYYAAQRLKIDKNTYTNLTDIKTALAKTASMLTSNTYGANTVYSQPIKYVLDSEGKVSSIVTLTKDIVTDNNGAESEVLSVGYNSSTNVLKLGHQMEELKYTTSTGFDSQIAINSSTLCVVVGNTRTDDTDYKVTTATSFLKSNNRYKVEAVDVSKSGLAKMILIYGANASVGIDTDTVVCVISKISTKKSALSEGDAVTAFEVYENGVLKTYEAEDTSSDYSGLHVGDVVRFGFNDLGQINEVRMEMDSTNLVPMHYDSTVVTSTGIPEFSTKFGTVFAMDSSLFRVSEEFVDAEGKLSGASTIYNITSSTKFYQVDLTSPTPTVEPMVNNNAIIEYGEECNPNASKIFVQTKSGLLRVVVLYLTN